MLRRISIGIALACVFGYGVVTAQTSQCLTAAGVWQEDGGTWIYRIQQDGNGNLTGTLEDIDPGNTICPTWPLSGTFQGSSAFTVTATNPNWPGNCYEWFRIDVTMAGSTCRTFSGSWTNPFTTGNDETGTRYMIIDPAESSSSALNTNNHRDTSSITFDTTADLWTAGTSWIADLEYATSGNKGSTAQQDTFQTQLNASTTRTYQSRGGKITLHASTTVNGSAADAPPVKIFVLGEAIPNSEITTRLNGLYSGATPGLLTGIAYKESTYYQFFPTATLYGKQGRWPYESYDGGSHIGLMMVPITFDRAWDWYVNTTDGATVFQDKLATASRLETSIRNANPGLRALTATELENMALVLYGPFAAAGNSNQYYIAAGSPVDWIINTANNQNGVDYADFISSHIQ